MLQSNPTSLTEYYSRNILMTLKWDSRKCVTMAFETKAELLEQAEENYLDLFLSERLSIDQYSS